MFRTLLNPGTITPHTHTSTTRGRRSRRGTPCRLWTFFGAIISGTWTDPDAFYQPNPGGASHTCAHDRGATASIRSMLLHDSRDQHIGCCRISRASSHQQRQDVLPSMAGYHRAPLSVLLPSVTPVSEPPSRNSRLSANTLRPLYYRRVRRAHLDSLTPSSVLPGCFPSSEFALPSVCLI